MTIRPSVRSHYYTHHTAQDIVSDLGFHDMHFAGVDPGVCGAAVAWHYANHEVALLGADVGADQALALQYSDVLVVEQQYMHANAGTATKLSHSAALLAGAVGGMRMCIGLSTHVVWVPPATWQAWVRREVSASGKVTRVKTKEAARLYAERTMPPGTANMRGLMTARQWEAICDAWGIAAWWQCMRQREADRSAGLQAVSL